MLGSWEGGKMEFKVKDMGIEKGLKAAVLVQKGKGGPIIAAAKI